MTQKRVTNIWFHNYPHAKSVAELILYNYQSVAVNLVELEAYPGVFARYYFLASKDEGAAKYSLVDISQNRLKEIEEKSVIDPSMANYEFINFDSKTLAKEEKLEGFPVKDAHVYILNNCLNKFPAKNHLAIIQGIVKLLAPDGFVMITEGTEKFSQEFLPTLRDNDIEYLISSGARLTRLVICKSAAVKAKLETKFHELFVESDEVEVYLDLVDALKCNVVPQSRDIYRFMLDKLKDLDAVSYIQYLLESQYAARLRDNQKAEENYRKAQEQDFYGELEIAS